MIYELLLDSSLLVVCILCLKFKIYFPDYKTLNYVLIFASTVNLTLTLYRYSNG
jgi:hypothetical protein